MTEQHRISQKFLDGYGPASTWIMPYGGDGYISVLNLSQNGPINIGMTNRTAYIVDVECRTVDASSGGSGIGITKRTAAYRLSDGYDGYLQLVNQSAVQDFGGQVYPRFFTASHGGYNDFPGDPEEHPEIHIQFKVTSKTGYYLRFKATVRIEAWEPF
jgi:hypothetical protein